MQELDKSLGIFLMFITGAPLLVMFVTMAIGSLVTLIAAAILLIMNTAMIFTSPSRCRVKAFLFWSLLPLILGIIGSATVIGAGKLILFIFKWLGYGDISANLTSFNLVWFSTKLGAIGTAVNLIPASLNYSLSLNKSGTCH